MLVPLTDLAFFVDVDNTLIDNDAAKADLAAQIERLLGRADAARFWDAYEDVRRARELVDYPRTLEQFRARYPDVRAFPEVADLVLGYPYGRVTYPGALEALAHLRTLGSVAILSDGDPVYQAAKIARAGLAEAVEGEILLFVHKELHLVDIVARYPARRPVLVDDKPRILAAAKGVLGAAVTTVFVQQGHYAAEEAPHYPAADLTVPSIGDLRSLGREAFFA